MSEFSMQPKGQIKYDETSNQTIEHLLESSLWSERKRGFEALQTIFKNLDSYSPKWEGYVSAISAVAQERNVVVQEKGLEAIACLAAKCDVLDDQIVSSILNDITKKYLADSKQKIRDFASQICTSFLEKRKKDLVLGMLYQCLESQNIKQVLASVRMLTMALKRSGPDSINVQVTMPKVEEIINKNRATFQQDVKDLYTELYSWIGSDISNYTASLDYSLAKTLETEFNRVTLNGQNGLRSSICSNSTEKSHSHKRIRPRSAEQTSKMPSSVKNSRPASSFLQKRKGQAVSPSATRQGAASARLLSKTDNGPCDGLFSPCRSYDIDSILGMMEHKQWSDRRDGLDDLMKLIQSKKPIEKYHFDRAIKSLRHLILNDTNVLLIAKAIHCVSALAKSQNEMFRVHAPLMMTLLFEKFKEKKNVIVEAIREATDAIYASIAFGCISRYVALSLQSQNLSVRLETELFLCRCFSKPTESLLKPTVWQPVADELIANLGYQDSNVREGAMKALGVMVKVLDESKMQPYVGNLPWQQKSKILRYSEAAVIEYKNQTASEAIVSSISLKMLESEQYVESPGRPKTQLATARVREANSRLSPSRRPAVGTTRTRGSKDPDTISESLSRGEEEFHDAKDVMDSGHKPPSPTAGIHALKRRKNEDTHAEIAQKLENLETCVDQCFSEVQLLTPPLYEELIKTRTKTNTNILRRFNEKLKRMESVLKSLRFEEK